MFKDVKILKEMLEMLKEQEGISPSYAEFVRALKENHRFLEIFAEGKDYFSSQTFEYFKKGTIHELALAIRMDRGYW